jgi:hypothetical protein
MRIKLLALTFMAGASLAIAPSASAASNAERGCIGKVSDRAAAILTSEEASDELEAVAFKTAEAIEAWKARQLRKVPLCEGEWIETPGLVSLTGSAEGTARSTKARKGFKRVGKLVQPKALVVKQSSSNAKDTAIGASGCYVYAGSVSFYSGPIAQGFGGLYCDSNRTELGARSCLSRLPSGGSWTLLTGSCRPASPGYVVKANAAILSQVSNDIVCYSGGYYRTSEYARVSHGYVVYGSEQGASYSAAGC